MSVVFVLLPLALLLACAALWAFARAARRGEFDDLTTPAVRVITDDDGSEGPRTADSPSR